MCATYRLVLDEEGQELLKKLSEKYSAQEAEEFRHAEFYPKQTAPVVGKGGRVGLLRWGFSLGGSARVVFNARSEGIEDKPFYRGCLQNRCAVPFCSYYEWGLSDGAKKRYLYRPCGGGIFYMAGLFRRERLVDGSSRFAFVILTTEPVGEAAAVHSRMPVILGAQPAEGWLDGSICVAKAAETRPPELFIS